MILLIEPNKSIRKRLCDLLSRERILAIGSYAETLEMIAKFKNRINIIITSIRMFKDILLRGTLYRLCQKLYIEIPPILVLYRRGDEKIKEEFEKNKVHCSIMKFDGEDTSFPERYIKAIEDLYPDIIADISKATEIWLKGEEPEIMIDYRKWLEEEGFLKAMENLKIGKLTRDVEQIIPLMKEMLSKDKKKLQEKRHTNKQEINYKQMYFELKKTHDELLRYVKELIDLIADSNN